MWRGGYNDEMTCQMPGHGCILTLVLRNFHLRLSTPTLLPGQKKLNTDRSAVLCFGLEGSCPVSWMARILIIRLSQVCPLGFDCVLQETREKTCPTSGHILT